MVKSKKKLKQWQADILVGLYSSNRAWLKKLHSRFPKLVRKPKEVDRESEKEAYKLLRKRFNHKEEAFFTDEHDAKVVAILWGQIHGIVNVEKNKCLPLTLEFRDGRKEKL